MKSILFILLCMLGIACRQNDLNYGTSTLNQDSLNVALLNVDKSWSEVSLSKGYYHSRLDFASDAAIEMMQAAMPLNGKKAIEEYAATHSDSAFTMQWKPLKAEVAGSGDLGYTYGSWMMRMKTQNGKDTSLVGNYVTVWQKQADGSWKYVVDGGNDTPEEVKE